MLAKHWTTWPLGQAMFSAPETKMFLILRQVYIDTTGLGQVCRHWALSGQTYDNSAIGANFGPLGHRGRPWWVHEKPRCFWSCDKFGSIQASGASWLTHHNGWLHQSTLSSSRQTITQTQFNENHNSTDYGLEFNSFFQRTNNNKDAIQRESYFHWQGFEIGCNFMIDD